MPGPDVPTGSNAQPTGELGEIYVHAQPIVIPFTSLPPNSTLHLIGLLGKGGTESQILGAGCCLAKDQGTRYNLPHGAKCRVWERVCTP